MKKRIFLLGALFACLGQMQAQKVFKFAFVSDTHVGSETGAEDLRRTVADINKDTSIRFVVHTGDVTEFGADSEIRLAKQILDSLNKPYYIIPGNHDANWSESGSNTFKKIFGAETFAFRYGGYLFVGTGSGPNMRMGPGQIPRENILWLDSVLSTVQNIHLPTVFLNHYPQNADLNNWFEVTDLLRKRDTRIILHGHGHVDRRLEYDGIPATMGRSNLRANKDTGAYNIVTVRNDSMFFQNKTPGGKLSGYWNVVAIPNHHFTQQHIELERPSYAINDSFPNVRKLWQFHDKSDIGAGMSIWKDLVFFTNTAGQLNALNVETGKVKWHFSSEGKVYATPYVYKDIVVFASSDENIYAVSCKTGKLLWKHSCQKPNVANPLIVDGRVYIGGSDGIFRSLDVYTGKVLWQFDQVSGFVVDRPLYYEGKVYFGCWHNDFYALDALTGALVWKWNNGASNRMFSPAACWPVGANNRIFIVAPDRYMTVLDATNGNVVWRKKQDGIRFRESMGLSNDSSMVYVKTMDGNLLGISTVADSLDIVWRPEMQIPYEICPTPIPEREGHVFVPTNSGLVLSLGRRSNKVDWKYKVSNGLVTGLLPTHNHILLVTTMDGTVTALKYN
ncbi:MULTISPECIES: outer membrane protein assembly factor BamB family protein [Chitinophagaceae]